MFCSLRVHLDDPDGSSTEVGISITSHPSFLVIRQHAGERTVRYELTHVAVIASVRGDHKSCLALGLASLILSPNCIHPVQSTDKQNAKTNGSEIKKGILYRARTESE